MARIAGVVLPNERKVVFGLMAIYGVGSSLSKKIIQAAKISEDKRIAELTDDEVGRLQKEVEKHPIEGELRRIIASSNRRLEEIGSYRGLRNKKGLPSRGQRTRSNARTKRGRRQTVGAMKKDARVQKSQKP